MRNPDWKEYINDQKEGALIETRVNASGINCVRGTGIVNYNVVDIFRVIGDSAVYRKKYDKMYDCGKII
jgi:hypothetical protein